jgi:hypothetical protein
LLLTIEDLTNLYLETFIENAEELLTFNAETTVDQKLDAISRVLIAVVKRQSTGDVV